MSTDSRFSLSIHYSTAQRELLYAFSELFESADISYAARSVSLDQVLGIATHWNTLVSSAADQYQKMYIEARGSSDVAARAKEEYKTAIGQAIYDISLDIFVDLLPHPEDAFWLRVAECLDRPIAEAIESAGHAEPDWFKLPLLQLKVQPELLSVPWWLSRTHDQESFWCCRYPLAVSTHVPTQALELKFGDLRILSVTRPTRDLASSFPMLEDTFRSVVDSAAKEKLPWRLMDGVLGERFPSTEPQEVVKELGKSPQHFPGVTLRRLKQVLREAERGKKPNLIFYHGHWQFRPAADAGDPQPCLTFHDEKMPEPATAPLLQTFPPADHSRSIFIMDACSSARPVQYGSHIENYLRHRSVFIGCSYPLVAEPETSSAPALLDNILRNLKKPFIAHCLVGAQRIHGVHCDVSAIPRELAALIYSRAALCLFGDVRANLNLAVDPKTNDNVIPIEIKIASTWHPAFVALELPGVKGMTYSFSVATGCSPISKFELDPGKLGFSLPPLGAAAGLCLAYRSDHPDDYVILGPSFASRAWVALASCNKRIRKWDDLLKEARSCLAGDRQLVVGTVRPKFTTSYMFETVFGNEVSREHNVTYDKAASLVTYKDIFKVDTASSRYVLKEELLAHVDLVIFPDKKSTELVERRNLRIIVPDLDTCTANLLGLATKQLPRSVLITRRECLEKPQVGEFCSHFNAAVARIASQGPRHAVGEQEEMALRTFLESDPAHLKAIKTYCDWYAAQESTPFDWSGFACIPVFTADTACALITQAVHHEETKRDIERLESNTEGAGKTLGLVEQQCLAVIEDKQAVSREGLENVLQEQMTQLGLKKEVGEILTNRLSILLMTAEENGVAQNEGRG